MRINFTIIISIFLTSSALAQEINSLIKKGNEAYKNGDYKNAAQLYKNALEKDVTNDIAKFNLGNALEKQLNITEAEKYYNDVAGNTKDINLKTKALYNKGVSEVREQKLIDAIETFKQSLMLNPLDNDTRENLQKAINEFKKQQQNSSQNQKKQKAQKDIKNNKKANQEMIEQKFSELRAKEKQLQKMLQKKPNAVQPGKDW